MHQFIIKVQGGGYVKRNKLGGTTEPSLYRETKMRWCVEHHVCGTERSKVTACGIWQAERSVYNWLVCNILVCFFFL